jgi:hypothetical protein
MQESAESGEVNLAGKNITDAMINDIVNHLKKHPQAKAINLSNNKITDEGI